MKKENSGNSRKNGGKFLLFETSWEVCNKIGGIYTVLSTKARLMEQKFHDNLVFIGPDFKNEDNEPVVNPLFNEDPSLLKNFSKVSDLPFSIKVRSGRWKIPGSPQVVLVSFNNVYPQLNRIFGEMWEMFGVNSMNEYGDYREGCAFSVAAAIAMEAVTRHLGFNEKDVMAHFNEWTTGMGLLYLRKIMPEVATLFTTHATSIGRSICGNGKPLYDYFEGYDGDQMAFELNMEAKHSLEKTAAHVADCFTTVSDITAKECCKLLDKCPDVVTPNGFEPDFVPQTDKALELRKEGREKIFEIASKLKGKKFDKDCLIIATSGRNEFRNKGLDIFLDSMKELQYLDPEKEYLSLVMVPAWVKNPSFDIIGNQLGLQKDSPDFLTHRLNNEDVDAVACKIRTLKYQGEIDRNVNVIYIPCYLDGGDGVLNISYYDLLPAIDMSIFPSYYEPWGYTPLESVAFGVPTITSDKSGFGQWIISFHTDSFDKCGVKVIQRTDSNYHDFSLETARVIKKFADSSESEKEKIRHKAFKTSEKADWKYFFKHYEKAFEIAMLNRDLRFMI